MGDVIADSETNLAAIVDPELEMVEPMIDFVFKHGLRPAYIIDTHTHADHVSGARNLKAKTVAKLVMHEKAPSSAMDIRVEDRLRLDSLPQEFFYTPGHAKDLVSILLPGRILSGDALLNGSCGRTDLLNGQRRQAVPYPLPHLQEPPRWPRGLARPRLQGPQPLYFGRREAANPKMLFDSEEEFIEFMDLENPKRLDPFEHLAELLKANMT